MSNDNDIQVDGARRLCARYFRLCRRAAGRTAKTSDMRRGYGEVLPSLCTVCGLACVPPADVGVG